MKPSILVNTEYVKDFEKEKKKGDENPVFSSAYMKNKLFINLEKPADYLTILDQSYISGKVIGAKGGSFKGYGRLNRQTKEFGFKI